MDGTSSIYSFPYEPYPQQLGLMDAIYTFIESGSIGCLESPTGTGKSLSAICSSFSWMVDEEHRLLLSMRDNAKESSQTSDSWLQDIFRQQSKGTSKDNERILQKHWKLLSSINKEAIYRGKRLQPKVTQPNVSKNSTDAPKDVDELPETEFLLREYDSDENVGREDTTSDSESNSDKDGTPNRSKMKNRAKIRPISAMDALEMPKIVYCSRTHSQLSQFVREIKKTTFGSIFYDEVETETFIKSKSEGIGGQERGGAFGSTVTGSSSNIGASSLPPLIRCITLGSRKNLCINPAVNKAHRSDAVISEMCVEMQKSVGKKVSSKGKTDEG